MYGRGNERFFRPQYILLTAVLLAVIAAVPRFYGLGSLSFAGDEETTAFAAHSLAEGQGARMPSGMPYRRALPFTWLNAISARVFGLDNEFSYRVPAALLGTLTVPLLFIVARPLVGTAVALVAALLLAGSEWHIFYSRIARMYVPFVFFFVAAGFALWHWTKVATWRALFLATLLFVVAVSFHALGILIVLFAIIPIAFAGWPQVSPLRLLLFALVAGAAAYLYSWHFVLNAPYTWIAEKGLLPAASVVAGEPITSWLPKRLAILPSWAGASALLGVALGIWTARLSQPEDTKPGATLRVLGLYMTAALAGAFACIGQLYGAGLVALVFLVQHPEGAASLAKKIRLPAIIITLIAIMWAAAIIWQSGLIDGLKTIVAFPFPYAIFLAQKIPGTFVLFLGMAIYLGLRTHHPDEYSLRGGVLLILVLILAVGTARQWGGLRFLIEVYPFLLLIAAAGLVELLVAAGRWSGAWGKQTALIAAVAISVSGLLGGYGIPQAIRIATLDHGGRSDETEAIYPDHKAPGRFVRRHRRPNDIVVADDALQQKWYAGDVDYWFRYPATHIPFLYQASDGRLRDIYVDSAVTTTDVIKSLSSNRNTRIWVITSAETYQLLDFFLGADTEQRRWLTALENNHTPVFTGRDGVTRVYCLNCPGIQAD